MDTVLIDAVAGIVGTVIFVVVPLAYKLKTVISKHKTVLGKITAVINYMKAHKTTDAELEALVKDVETVISEVK